MLVANRDDVNDACLDQELELGVGIIDIRVVDSLNKCLSRFAGSGRAPAP